MVWLTSKWKLCRSDRCANCEPMPGLRDSYWSRQWLQQFATDPISMFALRGLLTQEGHQPVCDLSDSGILDAVVADLSSGALHICGQTVMVVPEASAGPAQPASDPPPPKVERTPAVQTVSKRRPEPAPEAATLSAHTDLVAVAQSLKSASEHGIPFCEECARAALPA